MGAQVGRRLRLCHGGPSSVGVIVNGKECARPANRLYRGDAGAYPFCLNLEHAAPGKTYRIAP
ncbi:hypothetical protein JCM14720_12730 [Calditerricola yamamurae]